MVDYSIGIFAENINTNMYGSSRNMYYLAKTLEKKGCKVTIFCLDNLQNKDVDLNKIYISNKRWLGFFPMVPWISDPRSFRVAKKAREMENEFDVFHSNGCFGFPYASNRTKPFVVHLRTESLKFLNFLKPLTSDNFFNFGFLKLMPYRVALWMIQRYTVMNSDSVFCNSKETATEVNEVLKVNSSDIQLIYNGIDTEFFLSGDGKCIRKRYGLENKKVLLCVIRLSLSKGINKLLSTMEIIAKKREDIVLLLVGGGELEKQVKSTIYKKGLSKNIILTGHITDECLADYYDASDLFIYPSSPGTTLLEAMASSKPFILYYKSGGVPPGVPLHEIANKKIGVIIKDDAISVFAEEILNHIDDNDWLSKQGKKGFSYVNDELSWDNIADEVIKYYEKIINKPK